MGADTWVRRSYKYTLENIQGYRSEGVPDKITHIIRDSLDCKST